MDPIKIYWYKIRETLILISYLGNKMKVSVKKIFFKNPIRKVYIFRIYPTHKNLKNTSIKILNQWNKYWNNKRYTKLLKQNQKIRIKDSKAKGNLSYLKTKMS